MNSLQANEGINHQNPVQKNASEAMAPPAHMRAMVDYLLTWIATKQVSVDSPFIETGGQGRIVSTNVCLRAQVLDSDPTIRAYVLWTELEFFSI